MLVPLADQDSMNSQEIQAQEENEKAAVIQKMYRQKLEKRKKIEEEKEQNEKAAVIQRMYRKSKLYIFT